MELLQKALTAVIRAHDGRVLSSPDELIGWTYADPSWARIAALVPEVVSCAEACDQDLALSVKAVVQRLHLCGEDGNGSFPVVMVGGVLEANRTWDIGKEVEMYSGAVSWAHPIRPQVSIDSLFILEAFISQRIAKPDFKPCFHFCHI
ncbi:N-acetyl-D-glucosamine kinase-like [Populus alba x Populus x berolinensis]|uniref:N-acetyl-D-glucosamine kinase-like n=1 Tax=Populus alba x Populus x berolinensis TaxID=444605 RepID=A0AAD6M7T1_9ROSI|nr:N-acetyl-D-glucosamine kinase-like [Populus alba x Populus x berolinensis]